jgi:hypothetical protein
MNYKSIAMDHTRLPPSTIITTNTLTTALSLMIGLRLVYDYNIYCL